MVKTVKPKALPDYCGCNENNSQMTESFISNPHYGAGEMLAVPLSLLATAMI